LNLHKLTTWCIMYLVRDSSYFASKYVNLSIICYFTLSLLACHLLLEDCSLRVSKLAGCCMSILIKHYLFEQKLHFVRTFSYYLLCGPCLKLKIIEVIYCSEVENLPWNLKSMVKGRSQVKDWFFGCLWNWTRWRTSGTKGFPMFFPFSHRSGYAAFFILILREKTDLICLDNFC